MKRLFGKKKILNEDDKKEVIKKLYFLYNKIKNKNFDKTIYSYEFFHKIKEVILYSEELYKNNFKNSLTKFFLEIDGLFQKKVNEQNTEYKNLEKAPKEINDFFNEEKNEIKNIIESGEKKIIELFDNEIDNIKIRLKESNNDVNKAIKKVQEKIDGIRIETDKKKEKELQNMNKKLGNILNKVINKKIKESNLDESHEISAKSGIITAVASTSLGISTNFALPWYASHFLVEMVPSIGIGILDFETYVAELSHIGCLLTGAAPYDALAIALIPIGIWTYKKFFRNYEDEYKKILNKGKSVIKEQFKDNKKSIYNDLTFYATTLINSCNQEIEIGKKVINIDKNKWEKIKEKYREIKNNIENTIELLK
jgi:hypothetical protein